MVVDIPAAPEMESQTTPRIADMTQEQLMLFRERLGLKLPLARLSALASLYQKETREPSDYEWMLLDTLLYSHIMRPHTSLLAALQTQDPTTAAALSRLMQASRRANGTTPQPTPESLFDVMRQAQENANILPPPPNRADGTCPVLIAERDTLRLLSQGFVPTASRTIEGTPWQIVTARPVPPRAATYPKPGELYSLLPLPADQDSLQALALLLTARDVAPKLHLVRHVTAADYLEIIFSSSGFEADFSLLSDDPTTLPEGYWISADEATTKTLWQRAKQAGLSMTTFGRATVGGRLVVTQQRTTLFSSSLAQLRGLARPRAVDVRLDGPIPPCPIPPSCRYELASHTMLTRTFPLTPALTVQDVWGALKEDVTALLQQGIAPCSLQLAVGITENEATSLCALWSALLALSRTLDENDIPLAPAVFADAKGHASTVTFALIAWMPSSPKRHETQNQGDQPIENTYEPSISLSEIPENV